MNSIVRQEEFDIVLYIAEKNLRKCRQCGTCDEIVACPSGRVADAEKCTGCGVCSLACPHEAIEMKPRPVSIETRIPQEITPRETSQKMTCSVVSEESAVLVCKDTAKQLSGALSISERSLRA